MSNTVNKKLNLRIFISILWLLIHIFDMGLRVNLYFEKECKHKKSKLWRRYKRIR